MVKKFIEGPSALDKGWRNSFYNVPPGEDFASALVRGLEDRLSLEGKVKPDRHSGVVIILNTARSLKRLEHAFFEKGIGILPKIGLVTDLSFLVNGLFPLGEKVRIESRTERLLTFEKLIYAYLEQLGNLKQRENSFNLAATLDDILRDLILAGLDVDAFEKIENMNLSSHWIQSLGFLKVIKEYKTNLNKMKIMDQEGFNLLLLRLIEKEWKKSPPNYPVIVAGSTGSRYPTARLMRAVSFLPKGYVVLPGVDELMTKLIWNDVGKDHPQYSFRMLYSLINQSEVSSKGPSEINNWASDKRGSEIKSRARILSLAMLPARRVEMWYESAKNIRTILNKGFRGVSILETASPRLEAETIAMAIRMALEKKKSVSLVTTDRVLAKRVTVALKRWRVIPDNSFGEDPMQTPLARFLRLILDFQCFKFDLVNFLSILKHPLCLIEKRSKHLGYLRDLEIRRFRGKIFEITYKELRKILSNEQRKEGLELEYIAWLDWLTEIIDTKSTINETLENTGLNKHVEKFESLIILLGGLEKRYENEIQKTVNKSLEQFLLSTDYENSSNFNSLLKEMKEDSAHSRKMNSMSFRSFFLHLVKDLHFPFDPIKTINGVYIWGTLESRTQSTDLCILGGLNEGTWPRRMGSDFWLNSKMRIDVGLPTHDQSIGLAAHDFQNAFLMREVIISRSIFSEGGQKLPSRWLLRLEKFISGLGLHGEKILKEAKQRGADYMNALLSANQYQRKEIKVGTKLNLGKRPCPVPPISAIPKRISVTSFSKLLNDPYEIYARNILRLRRVDPLYISFDTRHKGIFMHELMRKFINETTNGVIEKEDSIYHFLDLVCSELSKNKISDRVAIRLSEELKSKANDIIEAEINRRQRSKPINVEKIGEKEFLLKFGFKIKLIAKADRIDSLNNNEIILLDYKSSKPSVSKFEKNMPQLDLEALIAKYSGFDGISERIVSEVGVIILGSKSGELRRKVSDTQLVQVERNFIKIVEKIYSGEWGYTSKIGGVTGYIGDYDHLARLGEWSILDQPFKQILQERSEFFGTE